MKRGYPQLLRGTDWQVLDGYRLGIALGDYTTGDGLPRMARITRRRSSTPGIVDLPW